MAHAEFKSSLERAKTAAERSRVFSPAFRGFAEQAVAGIDLKLIL